MHQHYRESLGSKASFKPRTEEQTEEQRSLQRLSEDEELEELAGSSPFKEFLLLTNCHNDARPEAFIYSSSSGGIDWKAPIAVKH